MSDATRDRGISVVIPARDEEASIDGVVWAVLSQGLPGVEIEVLVVDDGSTDGTAEAARAAGARVIEAGANGNPAAARNRGAAASTGDPIIFLDADCTPCTGWLRAILAAHDAGAAVVGGALDMPPGLPASARCDHYCGSYHVHPDRPAGLVPNHPPANLSVRREAFLRTTGFTTRIPVADGHEELAWQAELLASGGRIHFEPAALVHHRNRPGWGNLLRRNYRWGYSAIESKAERPDAARMRGLYRHPRLLIALAVPLAPMNTAYTLGCWLRAGVVEPLWMAPAVLAARLAYAAGMVKGGLEWLRRRRTPRPLLRPRWR